MFFFVNFEGNIQAAAQDKGKLFEGLIAELVDALGYSNVETRAKTAGKEYDIRARAKLGSRALIGQAKAWDKAVGSKELAEFIGSLDILDIPEDALGLFVSLTAFSPDAQEYLSKLKPEKRSRLETIVGEQVFTRLEQSRYPSREQVSRRAEQTFRHKASDIYLLISDRGNYFVQLLVRRDETRPKAFCVLDKNCNVMSELEFGNELKHRVEELRELSFLTHGGSFSSALDVTPGPVGPGPEGANWFEYKLPAPPQFFIGRQPQIKQLDEFLRDIDASRTGIRVYQVLSPSGVGKTSFMLKLRDGLPHPCSSFEDARNFRSAVDLLVLLQDFLSTCQSHLNVPVRVPTDTITALGQFAQVDRELRTRGLVGIIFVDQFESLFLKPELYAQFLDIVVRVTHDASRIVFCIARRNDQPTTFDDRIDLDLQRLRSMSYSVELKDFSRPEAVYLLSRLSEEVGSKISPELINLTLEFAASGFPWLCKRVRAHVRDALVKGKTTQRELVQAGIRAEELFAEDLAELDIMDREFIKDLAKYLPATIEDLSQKFDGKLLAAKLKQFQDLRLIRLIGRTFDTYNDVFKEYLKTGEVPLHNKYAFRNHPRVAIRMLNFILNHSCQSAKEVADKMPSMNLGTVQNVLRELRMLGLIETTKGTFTVDKEVLEAYKADALSHLIRDRVWKRNGLVRDVLNRLAAKDGITINQLTEYLKEGLPVLEVSDKSWRSYAAIFARWLKYVGLIRPGQVVFEGRTPYGPGSTRSVGFLPSAYMTEIIAAVSNLGERCRSNGESSTDGVTIQVVLPRLVE